MYEEFKVIK